MLAPFPTSPAALVLAAIAGCATSSSDIEADFTKHGTVSLTSHFSGTSGHSVRLFTAFPLDRPSCNESRIGECTIASCSGGAVTYADPGLVRAQSEAPTFTLESSAGKAAGQSATELASSPAAGQRVRFSGSGADVPAFASTTSFPIPLELVSPRFVPVAGSSMPPPASLDLDVSADEDLRLEFKRAEGGTRLVIVSDFARSQTDQSLSCDFDASSGSVAVPRAVLEKFRSRRLTLITASREVVHAGKWTITVASGASVAAKTSYAGQDIYADVQLAVH